MIECCFNIAPSAERKIMHEPCPPITPIKKSKKVPTVLPKSAFKINAERICAAVKSRPPIRIDFFGPNFL